MKGVDLILLFLLIATLMQEIRCHSCFAMSAAIENGHIITFFFGNSYFSIDRENRRQTARGKVTDLYPGFPADMKVKSAYHPVDDRASTLLVTGHTFVKFKNGAQVGTRRPLSDIFGSNQALAGGIDAAASVLGREFFFKGCQLHIRKGGVFIAMHDLRSLGMQCGIRSAWADRGVLVASKVSFSWRLKIIKGPDYCLNVVGPICFANFLKTDFPICKCRRKSS